MKIASEIIKNNIDVNDYNMKNYLLAKKEKEFASLCNKLCTSDEVLCKYTSKLEKTVEQLRCCKMCGGLNNCQSEFKGYVDFPVVKEDTIDFVYKPCKYKKDYEKNKSKVIFYETSKVLREAKLANIYTDDIARKGVLTFINSFLKDVTNSKGAYLYGSFGSGKSYIMNALLNEISKKGYKCISIYYPNLLKKLKDSFNKTNTSFEQAFNELALCDYLLIDDIGADNNTQWSRDEVLSPLLQTRMDEGKCTFFTSNLNFEELEKHLSVTNKDTNRVKARRIIERIKEMCTVIELIGENKRNNN